MFIEDVVITFAVGVTVLVNLVVLSYYLTRLTIVNRRIKESSDIVKDIITELRSRLDNQDRKIMDQQVRLDILELKIDRMLQSQEKKRIITVPVAVTQPAISQATREESRRGLTDAEMKILKMLEEKPYSASEIKNAIVRSREHTARIMKKLFDGGYVYRDESKKPYRYRLKTTVTSGAD